MEKYIFDVKKDEEEKNKLKIQLQNKGKEVKKGEFNHYFYVVPEDIGKTKKKLSELEEIERIVETSKKQGKTLKIVLKDPSKIKKVKKYVEDKELGDPREYNIPYRYRYMIDKEIYPLTYYDVDTEGEEIKEFKKKNELEKKIPKLSKCAFDIETYSKGKPNPEEDPITMISYKDEDDEEVFYWTEEKDSEEIIIKKLVEKIKRKDKDIIETYNGTRFDWPYIEKRAEKHGITLDLGTDGTKVNIRNRGFASSAKMFGRMHLDTYKAIDFLSGIGSLNLPKNTLEMIYEEFTGKEKTNLTHKQITDYWKEGGEKLEKLKRYNLEDSIAAYQISEQVIPLYKELARLIGLPPYDVSRQSASNMVEWLLSREAHKKDILVPRRPRNKDIKERHRRPIKGGYVKTPETGLHEKLAVCDFKSLYPTIIVSKNIGPLSLCKDKECDREHYEAPTGQKFHKTGDTLVPQVVKRLIDTRDEVKKKIKETEDEEKKKGFEYRSQALKIIANSVFGYLGYPRARWYSRECAEAITSWGRQYIKQTIKKAEENDLNVIYGDTDATFIKLKPEQTKEDLEKWLKETNSELPGAMKLEHEGYYKRGVFVSKKSGKAAKKKYALLRENGKLEVKGFALVRRDWAPIAKKTQEKVIQKVLKEGKPEKAVKYVEEIIQKLRDKKINPEELIIYTTMKKNIDNYDSIGPHVTAARKLEEQGYKIKGGTVIGYIIEEGRGSISDRSQPIELFKGRKYDSNYYIENQVLPAAMRILKELGVKENNLKYDGKQSELEKWM
ncbi:MAG: DNA-directed DNA polymerase [archaeon]